MRLGLEPDLRVVGEAANGQAALAMASQLRPDVILMDIEMPEMDGIAAAAALRAAAPHTAVVLLTFHDDAAHRARARAAGAAAFVPKQAAEAVLLTAIRQVAATRALSARAH